MKKILFTLLMAFLLFSGCARQALMKTYYVMELPESRVTEIVPVDRSLNYQVDVRDFWVNRPYSQTNIAVRSASNELNYFYYAFWAVKPGAAVAELVYEILLEKNLFKVCTLGHSAGPDWIVDGRIFALERVATKDGQAAHVKGEILLKNGKDESEVLSYPFDIEKPLKPNNSMNTFARITSEVIWEQMLEFIDTVAGVLSAQ